MKVTFIFILGLVILTGCVQERNSIDKIKLNEEIKEGEKFLQPILMTISEDNFLEDWKLENGKFKAHMNYEVWDNLDEETKESMVRRYRILFLRSVQNPVVENCVKFYDKLEILLAEDCFGWDRPKVY